MSDKVRCITLDGFKHGRALLGRHQEIDLPRDEFERRRAQGLVADLAEFTVQQAKEEHDTAAELAEVQRKAQEEWDAARKRLVEQRKARDAAAEEKQIENHEKAVTRIRKKKAG